MTKYRLKLEGMTPQQIVDTGSDLAAYRELLRDNPRLSDLIRQYGPGNYQDARAHVEGIKAKAQNNIISLVSTNPKGNRPDMHLLTGRSTTPRGTKFGTVRSSGKTPSE